MVFALRSLGFLALSALILFLPALAGAHEVYVLDEHTIETALSSESRNPFSAYFGNERTFYFWGLVSGVVILTILFASVFHLFERQLSPVMRFLKRLAHPLVRLTASITLITFGWYGVLYGPELPLASIFGGAAGIIQGVLIMLGLAIGVGFLTRTAAFIAILIYLYAGIVDWYALTYADHFGAYLLLLIMGGGTWAPIARLGTQRGLPVALQTIFESLRPLAFPILRISFGLTIMFAALYAKYFHSELAYQVVIQYDLTRFFPFDPLFVVLGAFIIEFLAGLMMFLGVAVRWTALFLAFWLTMGHIFTVEEWWVHLILYGIAVAIFCHGYDRWSLEGRYLRRNGREPVL